MDSSQELPTIIQLVKKQPLFVQLTDEEAEELASLFFELTAIPDQVIVKEGEPVDSVFLIAQGTADVRVVTYPDNQAKVSSVAILSAGDAIGLNETGFYSLSGKRTATVVAITDMKLYRLSVAAFHGFSLSHTHVSEVMHKNVEDMLDDKF